MAKKLDKVTVNEEWLEFFGRTVVDFFVGGSRIILLLLARLVR